MPLPVFETLSSLPKELFSGDRKELLTALVEIPVAFLPHSGRGPTERIYSVRCSSGHLSALLFRPATSPLKLPLMELQSFDLLWLPEPIESCLHEGARLEVREAALDIRGPQTERYIVEMARCRACGQWYGLLTVLYDIMEDFGWDASDIEGFGVEDETVTAGVDLMEATISWASLDQQIGPMGETERPPPSDEEIQALDQTSTTWEIGQALATWVEGEDGEVDLGYVVVACGPVLVRGTEIAVGAPLDAEGISGLLRRAAASPPPPAEPRRPQCVRAQDEAMADALRPHLSPLGIEVEVGKTPLADEALGEITAMLLGHSAPPVFQGKSDEEVRVFLKTATRFYEREPWTRTEGDRFLGVRIGEDDWFFANVMGQMKESPGLSLFDDWLTVCRFVHNQRSPFFALAEEMGLTGESGFLQELADVAQAGPFEAAGALEGLTLSERELLHPVDAQRLDGLSINPPVQGWSFQGQYPVPHRFDADEGLVAPEFSLETYRLVIQSLLIALERRRATPVTSIKTTLDIDGTPVSLRYPSDGTERPYEGPPGYRLFLCGHDEDIHSPSRIPGGERIEIEAPAAALFKDVAGALGEFHDEIYEASLNDWKSCLWDDRASRRNPSPRIADLAGLEPPTELEIEIGGGAFGLEIGPALDHPPEEIRLEWGSVE